MFHFQLTQSSQPRITAVAGTAAGTFIKILAAHGAETPTVRPAERLHRQSQRKFLPQKRCQIKKRRTAFPGHGTFIQKPGRFSLFRFGSDGSGVFLEFVEALVQHHKSFFHAAIARHGHSAPDGAAKQTAVLLRKYEHLRDDRLNYAA